MRCAGLQEITYTEMSYTVLQLLPQAIAFVVGLEEFDRLLL